MKQLLRRIGYLWNRRRLEREMADEMAYHRELMAPDRRTGFGSELRLREDAREIWGWAWLDRLQQDLSYGARTLRNSPGFTLTAVLVLALGIGVPLTVFRAALSDLQGGSLPDPDTLVQLRRRAPGVFITNLPYPELAFYAANAKSFRSVIGISERNQAVFGETAAGREPEQIQMAFATSNYFPEFGIVPTRGRLLTSGDERTGAEPVALAGELFWQRRLGGDPAAIGQSIRVNGKMVRIVGVMPRSSRARSDLWMPLVQQPYVVEGSTVLTDWNSTLDVYARLRPGVSPKAAQQETLALAASLHQLQPERVQVGEYLEAHPILQFESDSQEFQIVLTTVALVLLLLVAACANLGTLVLARGVTREREIRIRMALGAGRTRVVRQLFTESLMLAVLCGLCGLVFSTGILKWIQLQHNPTTTILPDWRVVAVTFAVSLLAALVFGLPPALRLTSLVPHAGRARTVFLAAQVAVSCLLLIVSGLLAGALGRLGRSEPGFDYRHLVWVSPGLKAHGYGGAAAQSYLDSLRARIAGSPGVDAASQVWLAPWGNSHMGAAWKGHAVRGESRGRAVSRHDAHAAGARAQLPAGRSRGSDDQRSRGAGSVARWRCARQTAPLGRSWLHGGRSGSQCLHQRRRCDRAAGILPAATAKRCAGFCTAAARRRAAARFRAAFSGCRARAGRASATDCASGIGCVRRRSEEHFPSTGRDRHSGFRGPRAFGHWVGRTGRLLGGPAHA